MKLNDQLIDVYNSTKNNILKIIYVSGRMKNAEKAKHIKTIPPTNVTVFGDIR